MNADGGQEVGVRTEKAVEVALSGEDTEVALRREVVEMAGRGGETALTGALALDARGGDEVEMEMMGEETTLDGALPKALAPPGTGGRGRRRRGVVDEEDAISPNATICLVLTDVV